MKQDKKLFLIVEDFEDSRFMMRKLLEMAGYRVLEATDGEQAVKLAVRKKPALILMDLSLPRMDGLSATRRIRRRKRFAKLPIVAVSAYDSPESRKEGIQVVRELKAKHPDSAVIMITAFGHIESAVAAIKTGATDYLAKPIDFDQLNLVVNRFL